MKKSKFNTAALSIANLKAKPVRTFCLAIVSAVLASGIFSGSVLTMNLRQSLNLISKRFGADLMAVPLNTAQKAQAVILNGETGYFYFDAGIVGDIECTDGVVCASPLFFLTSLTSDCCDAAVQLIAYDPETDFVVKPWISEKHHETVKDGQLIIGSRIVMSDSKTIKLYNNEYPIAARLSPSASGFDTSIFMTMNTMHRLIDTARAAKHNFISDTYGDNIISAVLIKTNASKNSSVIASSLRRNIEGIDVLESQGIFTRISAAISGISNYVSGFLILIWVLAFFVLSAVFSGIIHERKKEFALLRIIGAQRKHLTGIVLCESSFAALMGAVFGIVVSSVFIFPFTDIIRARMELPYVNISIFVIMLIAVSSLVISVFAGSLASLYSALKISRAETYYTMREGE